MGSHNPKAFKMDGKCFAQCELHVVTASVIAFVKWFYEFWLNKFIVLPFFSAYFLLGASLLKCNTF